MKFLIAIIVVAGVIFALLATQPENLEVVHFRLPWIGIGVSSALTWMLAGWFAAGLLLGYFAGLPGRIGASSRARKAEKRLLRATEPTTLAERKSAVASSGDASDTQRLADEVARRTESATGNSGNS